ncbi:MAG: methionine ABC transporter ATP-binding protein [Xenophilus sp.]
MISLDQITKIYGSTTVLDGISLTVGRGEIAAIVGSSGAGKSTLAKCINLLERPTSGTVVVDGLNLTELTGARLRQAHQAIGTIFQNAVLLRRRTVAENIAMPLDFYGVTRADRDRRVAELLGLVGLDGKCNAYPSQLSGGQQQRVGIARALALRPSVLLADEATSGLDPATTKSILLLLKRLRDELDLTIVMITHEMDVVRDTADSVYHLRHGRIAEHGSLLDILTNSDSQLSQQLLPYRHAASASKDSRVWQVEYGRETAASTWLFEVARQIGTAEIGLLGASIEAVQGRLIGRASISVPGHVPAEQVYAALHSVGLSGRAMAHAGDEVPA